jgi:Zn-dependent membrane protease YugP
MQRLIGKVIDLFSMLQASNFFADFIIFVLVALMVELDAVKKALSEEKIARLVIDQSLAEEKAAR